MHIVFLYECRAYAFRSVSLSCKFFRWIPCSPNVVHTGKLRVVPVFAMKAQGQWRRSLSTVRFTTGAHWMDWVYPRAGLDALRKREISYVFREPK